MYTFVSNYLGVQVDPLHRRELLNVEYVLGVHRVRVRHERGLLLT